MQIEVRPFEGEPRRFFESVAIPFAETISEDDIGAWESLFEPDRALAAYDGDRIVGTAGAFTFELTVPGGAPLPAAGVTAVGVHPTHRRRGILRQMMQAQLEHVRDRGEPLAILWASEGSIYGRFGYGLGTYAARVALEQSRSAFRRPHEPSGSIRFVDVDEARSVFPRVYDAVLPTRPGFFARTPAYWDAEVLRDPEHWRRGASHAFHVVHETGGEVDGYARYRVRESWDDVGAKSTVLLVEKHATTPAAHLDLWRYLLDLDLTFKLEAWNVAPDDPLIVSVLEPRRLQLALGDGMWLRVVDVGSALAGRHYAGDGRVVLEVADEFCPWNHGRWALSVEGGVPSAAPSTTAADLACDVTDLGAVYLGAHSFTQLADAGRARELSPGALDRADAMFRTPRQPWCPKVF